MVQHLDRQLTGIQEKGREYNAVTLMTDARARELARSDVAASDDRPLSGIPYVVKDIIDIEGYRTSAGSNVDIGKDPASSTALLVEALESAGAVTAAKTNCQEFSYGLLGNESAFGRSVNPIHAELVTGGSSSGSAVMVAAGAVPFAVGTDTAGSVRVPAACCGVVGFKPTRGAVSVEGVLPLAPSCDTVGLFGRDVEITTSAYAAMSREPSGPCFELSHWAADTTVLSAAQDQADVSRVVAAVVDEHHRGEAFSEDWLRIFRRAAELYRPIRMFESFEMAEPLLTSQRDRFQPGVLESFVAGASTTRQERDNALAAIPALQAEAENLLGDADVLITPAIDGLVPTWAEADADPRRSARLIPFVVPFNILGWPAIIIPVGRSDPRGGPLSIQMAAPEGQDAKLLAIAADLEQRLSPT